MPRCGQISRRAETPPALSLQISRGWPRSIWAFIRPGRTSRASNAGYQNPSKGALEGRVEIESPSCMSMTDSEGRTFRIVDRVGSVKKSQPFQRRPDRWTNKKVSQGVASNRNLIIVSQKQTYRLDASLNSVLQIGRCPSQKRLRLSSKSLLTSGHRFFYSCSLFLSLMGDRF